MNVALAVWMALIAVVEVQAEDEMRPPVVPAAARIANGIPAAPRELPYMAYIEAFNASGILQRRCAGSLITRSAVLTAYWWCVFRRSKWTVRLGSIYRTGEDPNAWTVESIMAMMHPKYDTDNEDNNIAIIQLPRLAPVNEFIQPVHLPCSPVVSSYIGRQGIVSGWGETAPNSAPSDVLRWAEVVVVQNHYCKQFAESLALTDRQLCAASDSTTVWGYDRGGPLVLNIEGRYIQIGIYSMPTTDAFNTSHPAVYTRVTSYIDWIKLNTGSD